MGDYIEYSAKTKDEAITKACIDMGVSSSQLDILVVSEGSSGFFGFGSKPAVIKVRRLQEDSTDLEIRQIVESVSTENIKAEEKKEEKKQQAPKQKNKSSKKEESSKSAAQEDAQADPSVKEKDKTDNSKAEKAGKEEPAKKEAGKKASVNKKENKEPERPESSSGLEEETLEGASAAEEEAESAEKAPKEGRERTGRTRSSRHRRERNRRRSEDVQREEKADLADESPAAEEGQGEEANQASAEKPSRPIHILTDPEEIAEVEKRAKVFLADVFQSMDLGEVDIKSTYDDTDGSLQVDFEGDDMGVLIGKRGQTLDSLQYLTSLVVNKGRDSYVRVKLDTEDYRRRRKDTLENLARGIAYKVKKTRRPVVLEPMNPYERRIIHSALQGNKFVETMSEGEEPYRHVVVKLKRS